MTTTTKTMRLEYRHNNAYDWDDCFGDEHRPEEYGELLAVREGYALTPTDPERWARRVEFFCH